MEIRGASLSTLLAVSEGVTYAYVSSTRRRGHSAGRMYFDQRCSWRQHTNVFVNCLCSDAVGGELCTTLKQKVGALSGYRLADQPLRAV
jgi:hypothetical protein